MTDREDRHSSKRSHHRDSEHRHKKRHRDDDHDGKRKHKKGSKSKLSVVDDDPNEDIWVEKNIDMDGENPITTDIPTADSLSLTSHADTKASDVPLPPSLQTETKLKRDEWMLLPPSNLTAPSSSSDRPPPAKKRIIVPDPNEQSLTEDYGEPSGARALGGGIDFFSSLGTERKKKQKEERPDPEKPKYSSKELNKELLAGKSVDEYTPVAPKPIVAGGPGSEWRMMKFRRVYEAAEESGKSVEEVARDRFDSLQAFEEAKEERRILDERASRSESRGDRRDRRQDRDWRDERRSGPGETRYMFNDMSHSGASSRSSSFRRPGESIPSTPKTPSPAPGASTSMPSNRRLDSLRLPSDVGKSPLSQSHTPIPSVMTPPLPSSKRRLSPSSLNKLQAKVLRAKLMGAPDAEKLEREYEEENARAQTAGLVVADADGKHKRQLEILPSLDIHGKLYDVGTGQNVDDNERMPGNRKKKEKAFESHDRKTGEIIRYNADDDNITLGEMLRQERFGAGMADQKNLDAELGRAIMGDGKFENDLEYMDDNAEKLARKKMRSDAMKRQFAINDYKKTQKALATCQFCFGEDDSLPKAAIIAMATRTYLACPLTEELVEGHCYIVPIQHHLSMLEGDDDVWEEVRNFMKCLIKMFSDQQKGVIFYETVISIKWQKHSFIECVPLPWDKFEEIPQYFKESILASETEWTQHKKLIDFSARPGGFRRAMVPNLPYFMVQFDHKGEKGYGHVIEGMGDAMGYGDEGELQIDEGEKGGGDFPAYFAAEVIGNVLEIEPRRWRRPKRVDYVFNRERVTKFKRRYDKYDWTGLIGQE